MQRRRRPTGLKGGDDGTKVLRRGRLGHGERFSTIVRIHRVIHYICNCVIVSGHFMQRHRASELHGSDFVDAAATVVRKRILKGYLNRHFLIDLSLRFELENVFVLL